MPCYQCSRCNKCGMLSTRMELTCAGCGESIVPGVSTCPSCGASYSASMHRGKMMRINEDTGIAEEFSPLSELTPEELASLPNYPL